MMFMISNLQLKTPISAMCHIRHEKKPPSESCLLRFALLFPMSYIQCLIFLDDHSSQSFFWSLLVVPLSRRFNNHSMGPIQLHIFVLMVLVMLHMLALYSSSVFEIVVGRNIRKILHNFPRLSCLSTNIQVQITALILHCSQKFILMFLMYSFYAHIFFHSF